MNSENMIKITVGGFMGILIVISLILGVGNKETTKIMWNKQEKIFVDIARIKIDIAILKGKMQVYENMPIDLRSRIEILETRYENLIFFQNEIKEKEKTKRVIK